MKLGVVPPAILLILIAGLSTAQTTKVLPWQPTSDQDRHRVYHPEPVLFVHGINANDSGWPTAINSLKSNFTAYDLPDGAIPLQGTQPGLNAQQEAYLHTFNYGDYPSTTFGLNPKSFDTIRWNAWATDRDNWPLTNPYKGTTQPAPADARQTLDERINGRLGSFPGIREAYRADPADPSTEPQIVLVAHSMGGLLSHYYLLNKPTDHGVRRLVTMATPHLGSHVANCRGTFV